MKFLAILKDSFREAVDAKVFSVMVGVSVLVVLFMASISYRPVTVEGELRRSTESMTWALQRTRPPDAAQPQPDGPAGKAEKGAPAAKDEKPQDLPAPAAPVTIDPPSGVDIEQFEKVSGGPAPWEGEYRFRLVWRFNKPKDAEAFRAGQQRLDKEGLRDTVLAAMRGFNKNPWLDRAKTSVTLLPADDDPNRVIDLVHTGTNVTDPALWPNEPALFFGLVPLTIWHNTRPYFASFVMDGIVNWAGAAVAMLLSTIITAFFIPNMLRKGTVDLLIVKPLSRPTLLVYKYIGGLTFMFLNTVVIVVGIYLVMGLRTGLWINGFLVSILVLTFEFAVYYSFSALFAVLTRSVIVSILMTAGLWFVLFIVGLAHQSLSLYREIEKETPNSTHLPPWVYTTSDVVHFVLPRIHDLDTLNSKVLHDSLPRQESDDPMAARQRKMEERILNAPNWPEALGISSVFIVVMLTLACWRFSTRDY